MRWGREGTDGRQESSGKGRRRLKGMGRDAKMENKKRKGKEKKRKEMRKQTRLKKRLSEMTASIFELD